MATFLNKFIPSKKQLTYTIHHQSIEEDYFVTVVTPVYNGEKFLKKSIESVLNQSLGYEKIQYILIDDCSTDRSKEILLEYAANYHNITLVSLDCNSGSPGRPRNIGIQLATAPYITFLDADDWFHPDGLKTLYDILDETGDPYVVGRTFKVDNYGITVVGEHQCCKDRRKVSPFTIPHIFHHLGPTGRMMRTSFLKEHQIQFPEMKFAEDKQFFIDVLTKCNTISTTTKPIYYANRLNDTKTTRLTNQTNILQKTYYNVKVLQYILNQQLDLEMEKMVINRLYEFDLMRRFFTTPHFERTKFKRLYFYIFKQHSRLIRSLPYDVSQNFLQPIHNVMYDLIRAGKYKQVIQLLEWEKKIKTKEIVLKENRSYFVTPIEEEKYKYIPLPIYIIFTQHHCEEDQYTLHFQAYGEAIHSITDVLIRDGKNAHNEYIVPVMVNDRGEGRIQLRLTMLKDLPPSNYSIFIRYNDYERTHIRQQMKQQLSHRYMNREFTFSPSHISNLALKINELTGT